MTTLTRIQQRRYIVDGDAPSTLDPGQLSGQTQGLQLFLGDNGGNAKAIVPVRFFSVNTSYAQNDLVASAGIIYRAKNAVGAGAWDAADWEAVTSETLPNGLVYEYDAGFPYSANDICTWQGGIYRANGTITGDPTAQPSEWTRIDTNGIAIPVLPADAVGVLTNDGVGGLSWASVFPADDPGYLLNDGAGNLSWGDPLPASDEGFLRDDGGGNLSWYNLEIYPDPPADEAPIPDIQSTRGGFLFGEDTGSGMSYAWEQVLNHHHRNFVLNPSFEIWNNRLTTYNQDEADAVQYQCARWFLNRRLGAAAGAAYDVDVSKLDVDLSFQSPYYTQTQTAVDIYVNSLVNIGGSIFPNDAGLWWTQRLGVFEHMSGGPISISFMGYADITHDIVVALRWWRQPDLIANTEYFTVQLTPNPQKFEHNIEFVDVGPQAYSKDRAHAEISFFLQCGSTLATEFGIPAVAGATGSHKISEVMVETTPKATHFFTPPVDDQLPKIQRFEYGVHNHTSVTNVLLHTGVAINDSTARIFFPFPTEMEYPPDLRYGSINDFSIVRSQGAVETPPSSIAINSASTSGATVNFVFPASTFTPGEFVQLRLDPNDARIFFKVPNM